MGTKKKSRRNSGSAAKAKETEHAKDKTLEAQPLVDSLESTIHLLTKTYSLIDKFHSDAQEDLIDNLAKLIQSYKSVDENRNVLGDTKVPMDMLDHLDRPGAPCPHSFSRLRLTLPCTDGKVNPTLFTKLKIETCLEERERMRKYQKCFDDVREKLHVDDTDEEQSAKSVKSGEEGSG